jgi:predicted kinase
LYGDEAIQGNPANVFSILYGRLEEEVSKGNDVLIDATNINKRDRSKAIEIARKYDCKTCAVVMDTPIAVCIRRNDARERKVPDFVFDRMIAKYEEPTLSEGFDIIERKDG